MSDDATRRYSPGGMGARSSHYLSASRHVSDLGRCCFSAYRRCVYQPTRLSTWWLMDLWWWPPVISPRGRGIWMWNFAITASLTYIATAVPLQLGFPELFGDLRRWDALNYACDGASLLNLFVKARTCFLFDGMLVTDPGAIVSRYLHDQFPVDAVAALPIFWTTAALSKPEWRVLRILLVTRPFFALLRRNAWVERTFRFNPAMQRLAPLLVLLLCSCHWAGCLYWAVSQLDRQADAPTTFLPSDWLLQQSSSVRYMHAFSWGLNMLSGFVPYDVAPATAAETAVSMCVIFAAIFMNTVIVSSTTAALQAMDSKMLVGKQVHPHSPTYILFTT